MVLSFYSQSISSFLIYSFFCSSLRSSLLFTEAFLSAGKDESKFATDPTTATYCKVLNPGSLGSYSYRKLAPFFCLFSALQSFPLYQTFEAVILFIVKVPVLSEQIQLVAPKVSTASKNFTKTFFSDSALAVIDNPTVISTMSPSGTLAVITPIAKTKLRIAGYPMTKPKPKRRPPTTTEKIVSRIMNLLIYCWRGVIYSSSPAEAAKLAI